VLPGQGFLFGTAEAFAESAQWHIDKIAKTGFVGLGVTNVGRLQDF
jgi:hypothetical protein